MEKKKSKDKISCPTLYNWCCCCFFVLFCFLIGMTP